MSWDLYVAAFPAGIDAIDELGDDYEAPPFATGRSILEAMRKLDPSTSIQASGVVDFGPFQVDLTPLDEPSTGLMLFGHGDPRPAIPLLLELATRLGVRVYDIGAGTFLRSAESSSAGAWMAFRDHAIGARSSDG